MSLKGGLESVLVKTCIDYLFADPENRILQVMAIMDCFVPKRYYPWQRAALRRAIERKDNWYRLLKKITYLDRDYATRLVKTFVVDANIACWQTQEDNRSKLGCNIPWAILLEPTSSSNLPFSACWANRYDSQKDLSFDDIDSIIYQGKELGTHVFVYAGGEPLLRKGDIIDLCEKHQDCIFLAFTNGILIDEDFCKEMLRVANFVPAINVERFAEAAASKRGEASFRKASIAMYLMRTRGLAFGVSSCCTSANVNEITSEDFFNWIIRQGALFAWFLPYVPIGPGASTYLMIDPTQREYMYHFIRNMRDEKPLFTMDFWNDSEFVGGCIAGGRRYLYINAAGDIEPCIFAHYSNANIHDATLLDALRSPLFMGFYHAHPFNRNLLRPCPILDNPGVLANLVESSEALSTNPLLSERASELCEKCRGFAEAWEPIARRLWENPMDARFSLRERGVSGQSESELERLRLLGKIR